MIPFSEDILGETVHLALPFQPLGFATIGLVYDIHPQELKQYLIPVENE